MKSWFVLFTVLLFCGMSSYVSADEYSSSGYGNSAIESPFEKIKIENKTDLWFADYYLNKSHLHLTSLQGFSLGGVDDTAKKSIASSGRISTPHNYLELTPIWGYTFGGEFDYKENDETIKIAEGSSFGFRLAYDYEYNSQFEFIYSHQETELTGGSMFPRDALFGLDVDYYHIGGSVFWDRGSQLEPYITGTLGLTHMNPDDLGADPLTRFSMGIGGGVRYFPARRVGLYTGVRGLVTFVDSDIEVYSGSRGSYVVIEADTVWQFQVCAGLIIVF